MAEAAKDALAGAGRSVREDGQIGLFLTSFVPS